MDDALGIAGERRAAGLVLICGFGLGLVGPLSVDAVYPEVAEVAAETPETVERASNRETMSDIEPRRPVRCRFVGAAPPALPGIERESSWECLT